jgi:hypothetical protein
MLRVTLGNSQAHRTLKPLYAFAQSTPKSVFLDPAWDSSVPIYAGMALAKTIGDSVTVVGNGTTGPKTPYGLAAFMEGVPNVENEISNQGGVNAAAVWVLGPDAEFEVLAPAFDSTATWLDPGNVEPTLVYAYLTTAKRGQLCPVGAGTPGTTITDKPVARLLKISSATKIVIGGLDVTSAAAFS